MKDRRIKLSACGFFACPPVSAVHPATIPEGSLCVEILTAGRLFFELDGAEREFHRGTVFSHIAGEHTICRTDAADPYRCYVLRFSVRDAERQWPRVTRWANDDEPVEFAAECIRALQDPETDNALLSAYAYTTLRWKGLLHRDSGKADCPQVLRRALDFIDANFASRITAENVSKAVGMSRPYLFELFRTHLRKTPHQYILMRRVERAKTFLSSESLPIKDIAEKCGFDSLEVFYRCFRRAANLTPADYRKRYRVYPRRSESPPPIPIPGIRAEASSLPKHTRGASAGHTAKHPGAEQSMPGCRAENPEDPDLP